MKTSNTFWVQRSSMNEKSSIEKLMLGEEILFVVTDFYEC